MVEQMVKVSAVYVSTKGTEGGGGKENCMDPIVQYCGAL